MSDLPGDLLYTSEHEWLRLEGGVAVALFPGVAHQSHLGQQQFGLGHAGGCFLFSSKNCLTFSLFWETTDFRMVILIS